MQSVAFCAKMMMGLSDTSSTYPLNSLAHSAAGVLWKINKSNEAVWEKFQNEYLPRHGSPRILISDQGAEFKGKEWNEFLRGNRIEHNRTTPFHPQSNGKTERSNRTLKGMLKKLIDSKRDDWEEKLGPALWAIRTNVSMVTGYSPFFLHHSRPARAPVNDMLNGDPDFTLENRLALQAKFSNTQPMPLLTLANITRPVCKRKLMLGKLRQGTMSF